MKKLQKWQKTLIAVVVVLFALSIAKDILIKTVVTTAGSSVLGAPLKIGHFSLGIVTQRVRIKNIRVDNPAGFPKGTLVDIPEASVNFDVFALLGGKVHLPLLVFNLKEMIIVKDKDGNLNVDALKVSQGQEKPAEPKKTKKEAPQESKPVNMQIDVMKLNIGRVILKDYTKGTEPLILVYQVDLKDKVFTNITSPQEMATVIMVQGLGPTALKGAKVYAAATLLGVGFLPAGVAGVLMGKDHATQVFPRSIDRLHKTALDVLGKISEVKLTDVMTKEITGKVDGADVTIRFAKGSKGKSEVTVAVRKMMIPKPEIAGGILYHIEQRF